MREGKGGDDGGNDLLQCFICSLRVGSGNDMGESSGISCAIENASTLSVACKIRKSKDY